MRALLLASALAVFTTVAAASEIATFSSADLNQRCQASPEYCQGFVDGVAQLSAWRKAGPAGCLLRVEDATTFEELRAAVLAHIGSNPSMAAARAVDMAIMAAGICPGRKVD